MRGSIRPWDMGTLGKIWETVVQTFVNLIRRGLMAVAWEDPGYQILATRFWLPDPGYFHSLFGISRWDHVSEQCCQQARIGVNNVVGYIANHDKHRRANETRS